MALTGLKTFPKFGVGQERLIFSLETVRRMTHGFCVVCQSSESSLSQISSEVWFQDQ